MNNTELLPCPFCGNTEPKLVPQGNAPEAFAANLTETAIKKWNTIEKIEIVRIGNPMPNLTVEEAMKL